ncbi:hypothetical protein JHK84_026718 [Glycine max]|nr:hypothetical protein JHK86_026602 [Glycine max]KAG5150246.1 hypothetical protein JHK84_026718 [Glycine max]
MVSLEKDSNETTKTHRTIIGKSMRTMRSKLFQHDCATNISSKLQRLATVSSSQPPPAAPHIDNQP